MTDDKKRIIRRWRFRALLAVGSLGIVVAAFSWARQPAPSAPQAQDNSTPKPATEYATDTADKSEYLTRPVAFIGRDIIITHEELGEYLIARRGVEKVELCVNDRIIELAAREAGIEVSGGEIEASFNDDLKELGGISRNDFIKQVLRKYNRNLVEWKEDFIKPKLIMGKMCKTRIHVTEDDIHDAFEARYGEKVECRIIQWRDKKAAAAGYTKIREGEQAFNEEAKHQMDSALASAGGKIKPINKHLATYNPLFKEKEINDQIEREVFRLQPGEITELMTVTGGVFMVIKCDRHLPADATVNPSAVRDELVKEITERKTLDEIPKFVKELREKAHPKILLSNPTGGTIPPYVPGASRGRVVAYIYDNVPVTREDLGEYLITRYGAESMALLVNKRIIEEECKAKNITIDSGEIEVALTGMITKSGFSRDQFVKQVLPKNRTTLPQYKEDVLRPQLQMTKLSIDHVKVTDDDLRAAYEAYYGEKIECRLILWPKEERKYAMGEYAKLRDSEEAFAEKASHQASHVLAHNHGHLMNGDKIQLIGRHTLGNEDLERELFSLQPGEVSKLVETPEGIVVTKCDKRIPPDKSVSLESVREKLSKEIKERKVQREIPLVFAEMYKRAEPRLLLKDMNQPTDLTAEVQRDVKAVDRLPKPPEGN